MSLRSSRGDTVANSLPHEGQKRAPAGASAPHRGQTIPFRIGGTGSDGPGLRYAQTPALDGHAPILDIREPGPLGDAASLVGPDPELEPQGPGADLHCLPCDLSCLAGRPKDLNRVDRFADVKQARICLFPEEFDRIRVHGDDTKTDLPEVAGHFPGGPRPVFRSTNRRDRRGAFENLSVHELLLANDLQK